MKRKRIRKTVVEYVGSSQQTFGEKKIKNKFHNIETKPIFEEIKTNKHES